MIMPSQKDIVDVSSQHAKTKNSGGIGRSVRDSIISDRDLYTRNTVDPNLLELNKDIISQNRTSANLDPVVEDNLELPIAYRMTEIPEEDE
jgi:hypothetical protein